VDSGAGLLRLGSRWGHRCRPTTDDLRTEAGRASCLAEFRSYHTSVALAGRLTVLVSLLRYLRWPRSSNHKM